MDDRPQGPAYGLVPLSESCTSPLSHKDVDWRRPRPRRAGIATALHVARSKPIESAPVRRSSVFGEGLPEVLPAMSVSTRGHDDQPADFSLVLGGPLYQLWRGTRLAGDALQLLRRRILVLALLAWGPLLVLSIVEGHAWGRSVTLPFVQDIELHARLLLALPLLILAELVVHQRMRPVVRQFTDRELIPDGALAQFDAAVAAALRLRNSIAAEVLLVVFVYVVGVGLVWRTQFALDVTSWYGVHENGRLRPSLAGWWFGLVSLPLFQFLLLRCISACSSGRVFCGRCRVWTCSSSRRIRIAAAASASWHRSASRSRRSCSPRA